MMSANFWRALLLCLLLGGPLCVWSQRPSRSTPQDSLALQTEAIKDVVSTLFQAMKNGDTVALRACFVPNPILQTVGKDRQGNTLVRTDGLEGFLAAVAQLGPGRADERIQFGAVSSDGDLASVWTPYGFYLDGKFSHCGANSFQLVRWEGKWKIQYLIDTRRKNGCAE